MNADSEKTMDSAEIARTLAERNFAADNIETAVKLQFLTELGAGGIRLQGAAIVVSKRHNDCMAMIAGGDGGGALGRRARRKSVENLLDAEQRLRRECDRVISENGLQEKWAQEWAAAQAELASETAS